MEWQVTFFSDFHGTYEKPLSYWKTMDEVPFKVKEYIQKILASRVLYYEEKKEFRCVKCLNPLDENGFCVHCRNTVLLPRSYEEKRCVCRPNDLFLDFPFSFAFYVFDVIEDVPFLYQIVAETTYVHPQFVTPFEVTKLSLAHVYQPYAEGIMDLLSEKEFSFSELKEELKSDFYDDLPFFSTEEVVSFLYPEGFEKIEKTPNYRYSHLTDLKESLEKENFSLATLTLFPLAFPQFEYLVKMGLSRLAMTNPSLVKDSSNFQDSFGVSKKYFPFMREQNITAQQLLALQSVPTTDVSLLSFVFDHLYEVNYLKSYVSIEKLRNYLEEGEERDIFDYYDYISTAVDLGLDLTDSQILFPPDFLEAHNQVFLEKIVDHNPLINQNIQNLSQILSLNCYEDDQYVIFPADSVASLIDEGNQMHNCVRLYSERISRNQCQIYFLRKKDAKDRSLVTVEVRNGKVVQAKARFNRMIDSSTQLFLKRWQKEILPIMIEEDAPF